MRYQKQRVEQQDGGWSTYHLVDIPPEKLRFEDLHPMSSYIRQQDIARMHYARAHARGEKDPHIMTWTAMQTDRRAEHTFPGLDYTVDGETLISANSYITCVLRQLLTKGWLQLHEFISDTYDWRCEIPEGNDAWQARADAMTRWLEESIQLDLYPNVERGTYAPRLFQNLDIQRNFVRIGRCDFIRHFVQNHGRSAVFNTSHFLHEHDDLVSFHSGYGDAVGLMISEGTILRPPIYRRGCLLFDGERWQVRIMGMADICLALPGELVLRPDDAGDYQFHLNPRRPQPIAIYTRAGHLADRDRPLDRTPTMPTCTEYTIVNRQIVSWKRGGGLHIPQNGFVLSIVDSALPADAQEKIVSDAWVEYEFAADERSIVSGIQAGPVLLQDGQPVLAHAPEREEFWASRTLDGQHVVGITPVNMNQSPTEVRKARTALGIRADGSLLLVTVDGCDPAASTPDDSAGATLDEVSGFLLQRGAVDALSLSGEGSSHLFIDGGLANRPSDRRGRAGVIYERMIPSIGIVV